jgi:hypothetical protein
MLSINLLKKQYELQNYFKIIVTGLLFGFSITDASASCAKIGQNSFTINPKALELESTSKGFYLLE